MKNKLFIFILILSLSSMNGVEHFEHYRNLQIQNYILEAERIAEKYKDHIPLESYSELIFNLVMIREIVYQGNL